jgi:glycosyltransferase involved in cell wall biosynthesis
MGSLNFLKVVKNDLMKPLASVCIITYNHEKFIERCIKSALMQQASFPYEILVGEDDSSDETKAICESFARRYPQIVKVFHRSSKEKIFIHGRMTGRYNLVQTFQAAQGRYIAWCEGDDFWADPHKLQKQVDFLEFNREYVACYGDAFVVDADGSKLADSKLSKKNRKDCSSEELKRGFFIKTLTICFRNCLNAYPPEFFEVINADEFLFSLLGNHGKGKYLGEIAPSGYTLHDKSYWSSLGRLRKKFYRTDTRAWLCRYYRRIGDRDCAEHFRSKVEDSFRRILRKEIAFRDGELERHIFTSILTNYKDIIDPSTFSW